MYSLQEISMKLTDLSRRRTRIGAAVCMLLLASQLAGCGGGDDSPAAPTPPPTNNTPPPPPPPPPEKVSLSLQGRVTDEPIANAAVTATVGAETFTTTADADGDYTIEIEIDEANADEFVTLSARGVGDQAFVEFVSLAGSFETLAAQAGDDDTLSSTENFSTQITNVSTAQAVFLTEANGGQPITSDASLQSLTATLNAQDVLDLAAVIKLAVDDAATHPLPDGQTSILELASDETARQAFINEVVTNHPEAFAAAQTAIAQDPNLVAPLEGDVIAAYLAAGGFTAGMLSTDALFTFNYSGRIAHFNLNEGGVGSVSTDAGEYEMTWTVEGSTIRIVYASPVETTSYDTKSCDGGMRQQYFGEYVTEGESITFLSDRSIAITTTSDVTYPDCASLNGEATTTAARTVLSMDNLQAIDVEELKGQAQTIYVWDSVQQEVVADVAEIGADGTGHALLTDQAFTWTVSEDSKIITAQFAGWSADYMSFRDIDELASDIMWEVRVEGGAVLMGAGASIFANPDNAIGSFAEDEFSNGRWYQFGVGDEASGDARLKGFSLRFDEGGVGAEEWDGVNGNDEVETSTRAFRYSVEEGPVGTEVVIRKTFDVDAQAANNCLWTGSGGCVLVDERRIIPIVRHDNEVRDYWVEVRRIAPPLGSVTDATPHTSLVRFYDYEDLLDQGGQTKPQAGVEAGNEARELVKGAEQR
jgi:hypothetical protein